MRRGRSAPALALVLAAAAAAPAAATTVAGPPALIIPGRGLTGLPLGATPAAVRAALGPPLRTGTVVTELGTFRRLAYPGLVVSHPVGGVVTAIEVRTADIRTARGAGVGSTPAALRRLVPGVRCEALVCTLGDAVPGGRVTTFFIRRGRTSAVSVASVVD